jgi:hypothetical protein
MSYRTYQFFREFGSIQRQLNRRGAFTVQTSEDDVRKKGGSRRAAFSKVETLGQKINLPVI